MVCDAKRCSLLGQWTLPEAVLTILSADAKRPDAAVAAKPAEPTPVAGGLADNRRATSRKPPRLTLPKIPFPP